MLRRAAQRSDRRLDALALAPAGRRVVDAIIPRARALGADLIATLSPAGRQALEYALGPIAERAAAMGAQADGGPD